MDISQYVDMFLAEAREHLQELNLAFVHLEEEPENRETLDEIFRIAHSFKGMSATMGFNQIAQLTHKMEDVLARVREERLGLGQDAVDTLLACLDALEQAVGSIESNGSEELDAAPLVARLEAIVSTGEADAADAVDESFDDIPAGDYARVVHVRVTLDANALMPGVRAFQLLSALVEHGQIVKAVPTEDEVDSFSGSEIQIWLSSDHEVEPIEAAARSVTDVADVAIVDGTAARAVEPVAAAVAEAPAALAAAASEPAAGDSKKHSSKSGGTVRIDAERLDQLMHLMGELVVHRTRVESLVTQAQVPGLTQAMQDLTRSSQALQTMVMQVRMIPVEAVLLRFPRLVRDLSTKLGKKVELSLAGQDTELDRTVVEALGDPLVHLIRNSLDHGLEPPDERLAAGKSETGTLEISARHQGGNVVISVRDDGRGIDPARVARKAAERGLIAQDAVSSIDMPKAIELLFGAGFSTADTTTDLSGRGVGMDAVRTMIRDLGGEVLMASEHGAGTTAQIRLPLTLAITAALLVQTRELPFAVPLDRVERTLRLSEATIRAVAGRSMLVLRDEALPIHDLAASLGYEPSDAPSHAVIVRAGEQRLAVAVELLVGQRELVTRPLPPEVGERGGLSGGAVLSSGDIALIVDCDALPERGVSVSIAPLAAAA